MAEKVVILEADIDLKAAVEETIRLKNEVKKLEEETSNLKETQGETSSAYITSAAELKATRQELAKTEKLTVQLATANKDNAGTIQKLEAETAKLRKEQKGLNLETEAGIARNKEINEKINQNTEFIKANSDQRIKDIMSVGHYEDATKSLKLELRENTLALVKMKAAGQDNTEAYQELLKITGELKDTIDDTREEIKKYASDTQALDQAIGIFKGIGAAAQLAEGASALLGKENEDLTKSIQKMVAIQSVLNAMQEIGNSLQKESAFMMGLNSVKTKAMSAAQAVYTATIGTSTGALKLFKTALLATGIGAIVVGLGLLIANWDKLTNAINKGAKAAEAYAKEMENVRKQNELNAGLDQLLTDIIKERGAIQSEITKNELENNKKRQQGINQELELLSKINIANGLNDEQKQEQEKLYEELIKKGDEAILLRMRLEKQLAEETQKAEEEKTKAIEEQNAKRIEKEKEAAEKKRAFQKQDEKDFQEFLDQINEESEKSNEEFRDYIEEGNRIITEQLSRYKEEEARISEQARADEMARIELDYENKKALANENIFSQLEFQRQELEAKRVQEIAFAESIGADVEAVKKKYDRAELELEKAKINAKLALASEFFGNVATLFGENTAVGKAAAVAQTTISTFQGATQAFSSLSSIPVVGPALGAVAAAAAVASGLANVKKILAVKSGLPGDKSVSASTSGGGAPVMPSATSASIGQGIVSRNVGSSTGVQIANATNQQQTSTVAVVVDRVTAAQDRSLANSEMGTI